jgi:hypothetical protein
MGNTQIDQSLSAALYLLGFNFLGGDHFGGEIAEIKGDMTIRLMHPPGEELKFIVELPGDKQMTFSVDRSQIVTLGRVLARRSTLLTSSSRPSMSYKPRSFTRFVRTVRHLTIAGLLSVPASIPGPVVGSSFPA